MATNAAYDFSLFESTAPVRREAPNRKKSAGRKRAENVVVIPQQKIEKIRRRKHNPLMLLAGFTFGIVVVGVVAAIICGQIRLTELNQKIIAAESTLADAESVYTQMEMNVNAKYSTAIVDKYAQKNLGMSKVNSGQKEYVNLSSGDKAEIANEKGTSILSKIFSAEGS
ncbi:MAG: hypothetical protein ACI4QE_04315 [Acutalibacteraceae bacterium]